MSFKSVARAARFAVVELLDARQLFAGFQAILDSSSTVGITAVGGWTRQSGLTVAYNGNQLLDSSSKKGQQSVKFAPTLPASGPYQIYGWWRSTGDRSAAVPFTINTADGNRTVYADERTNPGQWVLLGAYNLTAGAGQGVTISNSGTTGTVVADAVRFVQLPQAVPQMPERVVARSVSDDVQITWTPGSSDETSFQIERQTSAGGSWTTLGTTNSGTNQFTDGSPVDGASYRVRAGNVLGSSPWSQPVRAWKTAYVGPVNSVSQTYDLTSGTVTLQTTLGKIAGTPGLAGGTSDSFGYGWQKLSGDGEIVVQLSSLSASDADAAAGVMMRQSLGTNSQQASLFVTKASSTIFSARATTGAAATASTTTSSGTPRWLKLVRLGDVFTAYSGTDGYHWSTRGRVNVAMSTTICVGLVAASDSATAATATFNNVSITDTSDDHAGWTKLFNGSNLNGLYTYLPSRGVNNDPAGVFKVSNGELHILDIPPTTANVEFGYVATQASYSNYRLRWEYKWDTKKFSPKQSVKRDSGVMFNFGGTDKIWPAAPEFQVQEGDTADVWLIGGTIAQTTVESTSPSVKRYKEGGTTYTTEPADYRQVYHNTSVDTLTGWNRCELIVSGDDALYIVNGVVVNKIFNVRRPDPNHPGQLLPVDHGKILFQAEGAAVSYRSIEIQPLDYAGAPGGATVLFDGDASDLTNFRRQSDGAPVSGWTVSDGALKAPNQSPAVGTIASVQTFQDFALHVEFRTPFDAAGNSEQLRGNSGIYLQGRYELQVLDSWGNSLRDENDAGSIYELSNAGSNQAFPAEAWQSYYIKFTAARWSADGKIKVASARVSVWWNGTLVQDNVALRGPTLLGNAESASAGPLVLQAHYNAVQFRNIWVTSS